MMAQIVELLRQRAYYHNQGLPVAAIEAASTALALARAHGLQAQEANISLHLAEDQAFLLNSYAAAAENARRCLHLIGQPDRDNRTKVATAYSVLGFVAAQQRRSVDAVWALREALAVLAPLQARPPAELTVFEQRTLARAYINLAIANSLVGDFEGARALSEEALVLARAAGNEVALITLLENLGHYEIALGNYHVAEAYLVEGESLATLGHQPDWLERLSYFQQMRSEIYLRRGELQIAGDYASRALDTHVRQLFHFDRSLVADVNALFGSFYLAIGANESGLECLQRAERIYRYLGMIFQADRVHMQHSLARILLENGRLKASDAPPAPFLNAEAARAFDLINQVMDLLFDMYAAEEEDVAGHSDRVVRYALLLARKMNLPAADMDALAYVGPLHDLGKRAVPPEILNKPGALTAEEYALIKRHPEAGVEILLEAAVGLSPAALALLRHHHERWDGGGYPDGLSGEQIPIIARALSVADAYDAMTMDRPYRKGLPHSEAMQRVCDNAGTQFDPEVVAAWQDLHAVPEDFAFVPSW
jgi:HD-GYP domain-containing protein (c-di-GMP phosphodiesterase class II)